MYSILTARPAVSLRQFVSHYIQREVGPLAASTAEPVPARIQHIWEFQFLNQYEIRYFDSDRIDVGPRAAIVGPQTYRRARLLINSRMEGLVVVFRATGFYRLFGIDMNQFVNQAYDASSVMGLPLQALWHRLSGSASFYQRIEIIEQFLTGYASRAQPGISGLTSHIATSRGVVRISDLARNAGLSCRQLERRFLQQVGLSPKTYARIQRYESALRMKASAPQQPWSAVAQELGYCDQMHMVHDFHDLSGETPTKTLARVAYGLSLNPPAWFDFSELTGASVVEKCRER